MKPATIASSPVPQSDIERVRSLVRMMDEQSTTTRALAQQAILTAYDVGVQLIALKDVLNIVQSDFDVFAQSTFGLDPRRTEKLMGLGSMARERLAAGAHRETRLAMFQLELMPPKEPHAEGSQGRSIRMLQTHAAFVSEFAKFKRRLDLGHTTIGNLAILRRDARPLYTWLQALYAGK